MLVSKQGGKMSSKKKIMIIDDDVELSLLICDLVSDNGYDVIHAASLDEAYDLLTKQKADLIILDINLPDGTGFELCRELRKKSSVPVIFASARTSEDDKVNGLDIGGDDYIAKPYSLRELMSRIKSILRRTYGSEDMESVHIKAADDIDIEVDFNSRKIKKNGEVVDMSPREYDLFEFMLKNKGKALKKQQLIDEVWGVYSEVEQSTLTVHIRWLREKLEKDASSPVLIKTVWGVGYILEDNI